MRNLVNRLAWRQYRQHCFVKISVFIVHFHNDVKQIGLWFQLLAYPSVVRGKYHVGCLSLLVCNLDCEN